MNLTCLLGTVNCGDINPFLENGGILKFFEFVTILGILFGAMQFMETNPLRSILFRNVFRMKFIVIAMLSIIAMGMSLLLPFLDIILNNNLLFIPSFLQNFADKYHQFFTIFALPGFREMSSLVLLLYLIRKSIVFSLFYTGEIPVFKNDKGTQRLYNIIDEIMIDEKNIKIISNVLNHRKNYKEQYKNLYKGKTNIERIIEIASKRKIKNNMKEKHEISIKLMEDVFSNKSFCEYIAVEDKETLLEIIKSVEKYRPWRLGLGEKMIKNIVMNLFNLEESFLTKELISNNKEVYKLLFKSYGIIENYKILEINFNKNSIEKYTYGLSIILKECFENENSKASFLVGNAIKNLLNIKSYICKINDENLSRENNLYLELFNEIRSFLRYLENMFNEKGKIRNNYTLIKLLVEGILKYITSIDKINNIEVKLKFSSSISWLLFPQQKLKKLILITDVLHKEIKSGEFPYKLGKYTRYFLWYYGMRFNTSYLKFDRIGKYFENKFYTEYGKKIIDDIVFRKLYMPQEWEVKDGKIYYKTHIGKDVQIYPKQSPDNQSED